MTFKSKEPIGVKYVDPESYYDFFRERVRIMVFGGYLVIKSSFLRYVFNVAGISIAACLYLFNISSGIFTMIFVAKEKTAIVQAFYVMGLLLVSIGGILSGFFSHGELNAAREMLKSGVYHYDKEFQEECFKIKRNRIVRMRWVIAFISNGMYFCAFNFTVITPLTMIFSADPKTLEGAVSPYLPMHVYVPFNTSKTIGYAAAYAIHSITFLVMYTSFVASEELFISTTLQLTMEIEVMNYALQNMEKRAYLKMKKSVLLDDQKISLERLYDEPVFQKYLYTCIRESIVHHHSILRLKKAISPFIEYTITFIVFFFSCLMAAAIVIMMEESRPQLTLITDIFGFLPMCWVGQQLANESSEMKNALFDTPWPHCNQNIKVLLNVFMSNAQQPLMMRVRIFNLNLCLETFADMVSAGYKIMNVMRSQ